MASQPKSPLDIEEQIQNLAGDIYVQIEDKVSALVSAHTQPVEITLETIQTHPAYLSLENNFQQCEQSFTQQVEKLEASENLLKQSDKDKSAKINKQNDQIAELTLKLNSTADELNNLKDVHNQQSTSSTEQLSKEQNTVKQYQGDIEALQQTIVDLEQSMSSEVATKAQLNEQLCEEQKKVVQAQDALIIHRDNALTLERKLASEIELTTTLNANIHELTQTVTDLRENLAKAEAQVEQFTLDVTAFQGEQEALTHQLTECEKVNHDIEQSLEAERQSKGQQKSTHLLEIDALKQSIDKHRTELEALVTVNEQHKDKIDVLNQTIADSKIQAETQEELRLTQENQHKESLEVLNKTLVEEQHSVKALVSQLQAQTDKQKEQAKQYNAAEKEAEKAIAESEKYAAELTEKVAQLESDMNALKQERSTLTVERDTLTQTITANQKDINKLTEKYDTAEKKTKEANARAIANKEKQENEYNKARDTIKYLRDENHELSTKLDRQVNELEDKLREYRLRFEYAQKQLNQK